MLWSLGEGVVEATLPGIEVCPVTEVLDLVNDLDMIKYELPALRGGLQISGRTREYKNEWW